MADRGDRTRQLILDTALRLFRTQGYDKTTMRAIASEAGLSPGNAYYYFPSKQHLVQDFYAEIQLAHRRPAPARLPVARGAVRQLLALTELGNLTETGAPA